MLEDALGSEPLQGTTGHHGTKGKSCQRHCIYVCGIGQPAEGIPGCGRQYQPQIIM